MNTPPAGADTCAVVTGAGSGIGAGIATRLAHNGHAVALIDVDKAGLDRLQAELVDKGCRALAVPCDVTDPDAVAHSVERIAQNLGEPSKLVNGAGVAIRKGLLDTSIDEWSKVLAVNVNGYFYLLKSVVPRMRDIGGGSIVQIASITGHIGYGYPSYTASKGAILAITKQLAGELAPWEIRINSISPGVVETGLNRDSLSNDVIRTSTVENVPLGRLGTPADIASMAAFLLSDDAGYITGADILVDGGMISRIHWGAAADMLTNFDRVGS